MAKVIGVVCGAAVPFLAFTEAILLCKRPVPFRFALRYSIQNILPSIVWRTSSKELICLASNVSCEKLAIEPTTNQLLTIDILRSIRYILASYGLLFAFLYNPEPSVLSSPHEDKTANENIIISSNTVHTKNGHEMTFVQIDLSNTYSYIDILTTMNTIRSLKQQQVNNVIIMVIATSEMIECCTNVDILLNSDSIYAHAMKDYQLQHPTDTIRSKYVQQALLSQKVHETENKITKSNELPMIPASQLIASEFQRIRDCLYQDMSIEDIHNTNLMKFGSTYATTKGGYRSDRYSQFMNLF